MKYLLIFILLLLTLGCVEEQKDDFNELQLLSTFCDRADHLYKFSVCSGTDCDYVPVTIEGEEVRCGDEQKTDTASISPY